MEEVAGIPQLPKTPGAVLYAPLGDTPVDPDVVIVWGSASSIMLLEEAAIRAGVTSQLQALSRPTCMAVPAALSSGMVASAACIGNRVYTGATDGELLRWCCGKDVARIAAEAATIAGANAALLEYHTERRQLRDGIAPIYSGSPGFARIRRARLSLPRTASRPTAPFSPGSPSLTLKPLLDCRYARCR